MKTRVCLLALLLAVCLSACGGGHCTAERAESAPIQQEPEKSVETPETPTPALSEPPAADAKEPDSVAESNWEEMPEGPAAPSVTGALHVEGTRLTGENGGPVQLRGISTHGLSWFPAYVNEDCFRQFREEWNVNVMRLAMYTAENGGYCTDGDQAALKQLIRDGIAYAEQADLYVIVDWHILSDGDPNQYVEEAKAFFAEISSEYAEKDHILYEICNEPNGGTTWSQIKTYAQAVIPVIRGNDPDAVILVGTPNWSQYVEEAAKDPITEYDNIMYTLHYYAATHKEDLRGAMERAVQGGLPIFVSEYGICDASGNGAIDEAQANLWVEAMDRLSISYVAWNLSNKDETSALLQPSCTKTSSFSAEDLSASGRWLYAMLTGDHAAGLAAEPTSDTPEEPETGAFQQDGLDISAELSGRWESDGTQYYQYSLTLKNTTDSEINGWTIRLSFDGDVTLSDGWNGDYETSENTLTISSLSYNQTIPAGGTVTDVGFIADRSMTVGLE